MSTLLNKKRLGVLLTLLVCIAIPIYLELSIHLFVYKTITRRIIFPAMFAVATGCLIFFLSSMFSEKVNRVIIIVLVTLVTLYFEVQLVYESIFGGFMSLWQVSFGATAITNFWRAMLYGIVKILHKIIALLLPIPALAVLIKKNKLSFDRHPVLLSAAAAVLFVALHFATVELMIMRDNDAFSVYRLYSNPDTPTDTSIKNIGILATTRLEAKHILLGGSSQRASGNYAYAGDGFLAENADAEKYNVLDIDFTSLIHAADDETLRKIDRYLAQRAPTEKNEYTGILKDYNLVMLCCESYSPFLIDKERTPALYELSTNGFIFENYYGSFLNHTTNGEYTMCMGMFPDLSRDVTLDSFYVSQNHYLPFCAGNQFASAGAQTWAYHNYSGYYYSRGESHPNMGYTFKAADTGLDMELSWPASDREMMEKSIDDYINSGEQFCAYYMTFSGHYQYNWDNAMSVKNRAVVDNFSYSDTVKAYIACNMELEYALEYLMDRLETAGIADKTAIVLTNDHYPYGLTEDEYNELAGEAVDPVFEKFRSSFICYVPGMHVEVPTYCSTEDILPTILNLFGFEYDSRLLVGKDVLSPQAENIAVLADKSFITPDYKFDASTGSLTVTGNAPSSEELAATQAKIATKFQLSADILNSNYFSHALLGNNSGSDGRPDYPFTDIPEMFNVNEFQFVIDNDYIRPDYPDQFGFCNMCKKQVFLRALYMMSGETEAANDEKAVIAWALDKGLLTDDEAAGIPDAPNIKRSEMCLYLYRFSKLQGFDMSLSKEYSYNPGALGEILSQEEIDAILWCFDKSLMRGYGSLDSCFEIADKTIDKKLTMEVLYKYHGNMLTGK